MSRLPEQCNVGNSNVSEGKEKTIESKDFKRSLVGERESSGSRENERKTLWLKV